MGPHADVARIEKALLLSEDELGLEVQPTVVGREEWDSAASGFLQTIKDAPLVRLEVEPEEDRRPRWGRPPTAHEYGIVHIAAPEVASVLRLAASFVDAVAEDLT